MACASSSSKPISCSLLGNGKIDEIKVTETKPPLINEQCFVSEYKCDLYNAGYVSYTWRHLFGALMNMSILSLLNTWGTYTIGGTKISVTNLQSLKRMPSEAGLFNLWNALHQKQKNQHLTLNLTQLKQNFLWYSALRSSLVHFTISWTHLDFFSLNLRMMAWSCQSKRYSFISLLFVLKCLLWKKKKKPFVNQLLQPASNFFAKMV